MSPSDRGVAEPDAAPGRGNEDVSAPTAAELAAIVAAVEVAWPSPVVVQEDSRPSPWRWSGRWWASDRPVAANRRRP